MAEPLMRHTPAYPGQREDVVALGPWFHNLHLPDGSQTAPGHPLGDFPLNKWRQIADHLPADLTGWTALDVGCNAGFYAIELAKRGAHVLGIDVNPRFLAQAEWAAREFELTDRLEFRRMQVYHLAHMSETFDLVLFMGVFYHLRYPLLGLDIVAEKARRLMVFQTLTIPGVRVYRDTGDREIHDREVFHRRGWPKMAFIEGRFAGDPTNWWVPNHAAVEAMIRSAGLTVIRRPGHEIYLCEPSPARPTYEESGWDPAELEAATGRDLLATGRAGRQSP